MHVCISVFCVSGTRSGRVVVGLPADGLFRSGIRCFCSASFWLVCQGLVDFFFELIAAGSLCRCMAVDMEENGGSRQGWEKVERGKCGRS